MVQTAKSTRYFELFGGLNLNSAVKEDENGADG